MKSWVCVVEAYLGAATAQVGSAELQKLPKAIPFMRRRYWLLLGKSSLAPVG